ncbi:MAG TPA: hypothetical protein VN603_03775 [Candidatus Acidoferrales bacterium]|nr:hypothetical protein [Candidatus Acidoferrales bacterium]
MRSSRHRREPSRGSSNLRTVLLGIVVIVAGLGIGMLSAVVMHRGANNASLPAAPRVTPLAAPTAAPVASPLATLRARPTPSPTPVSTPSPTAEPSASPSPSASPTARATARPTPLRTPTAVPTKAATASATALATPALTPTRAPVPAAISTGFDVDIAQAVVRRYLDAIARGDNATARALLGASPSDATVPLPELAFVNTNSKIGSLAGRRTGDSSAAISVQITDGAQRYSIIYEVVQGPKGTLISGRDITR